MAKTAHFTPDALRFLDDLKRHNDAAWFEKNRARYQDSLRDPYLRFLTDLAPKLEKVSARFVVDPAPTGGSLARIHRDMRFVREGLRFKTFLSAHFAHDKAREGADPSFFLVLEPGNTTLGGGIRHPDATTTKRLKKAVADHEVQWRKLTHGAAADRFVVTMKFDDVDVTSPRFVEHVASGCKKLAPFVGFVTEAIGLKM